MQEELDYWQFSVLEFVLGMNPPFKVVKGVFKRVWRKFDFEKVLMVEKGLFLIVLHLGKRHRGHG